MPTTDSVPLNSLLIDVNNPRLEEMLENQPEAIRAVAANQGSKLVVLAKDIVAHGLNPSESLIVTRVEGYPQHYVVLEGNRRVAALKVLKNPELISGSVEDSIVNRFKKLSAQYQDPIDELSCVIVDGRSEAYHWIELRHTGENEGAGIVRWGAAETARFRQRSGQKAPHLQVLDFLEQRGDISGETRRKVPVTSLKRLLSNPYVRTKLGIDVRSGTVRTRVADDSAVAKGLKRVIEDLASGTVRTKDIYLKDDRIRYIDSLPSEDLPDTSDLMSEFRRLGVPLAPSGQEQPRPARRSAPSRKARSRLIPRDFIINVDETRVNEIYRELKKLDIEQYTNAVSVLFRVFLELSLDVYIQRKKLGTGERASLSNKLLAVADALSANSKLTGQQLKPVRRAAQKDTFLASTITTMHQYVHNPYFSPAPSDLRATWDSLQPFMEVLWS